MKGGIVAEFLAPDQIVAAVASIRRAGFKVYESYAPYPIEGLLEGRRPRSPLYALIFGLLGAAAGYLIQWWTNAVDYPLNVGGRPPHSAPAFIPITFESAILFASAAVFFGTLIHLGLPRLHHPLFDVEGFERASVDRFFLAVSTDDPIFDSDRAAQTLRDAGALRAVPFGRIP
jgi:hypothetical protein